MGVHELGADTSKDLIAAVLNETQLTSVEYHANLNITEMQLAIKKNKWGGMGGGGVWCTLAPCGIFRQQPLRGSRSGAALPEAPGF